MTKDKYKKWQNLNISKNMTEILEYLLHAYSHGKNYTESIISEYRKCTRFHNI